MRPRLECSCGKGYAGKKAWLKLGAHRVEHGHAAKVAKMHSAKGGKR